MAEFERELSDSIEATDEISAFAHHAIMSTGCHKQIRVSADYTCRGGCETVLANLSQVDDTLTVTLPPCAGAGACTCVIVKRTDATEGKTLTVVRSGSDTIDGAASAESAAAYAAYVLASDGVSAWCIVSFYSP